MKHYLVIAAGGQVFEFEGEIIEMEDEHLILRAKRGDIYIERKYLVFIQTLNEQPEEEQNEPAKPVAVNNNPKIDTAARFLGKRLKQDPLKEKMEEILVPPSQFPDSIDDDMEVMKNVAGAYYGRDNPITQANNLRDAAKIAMDEDNDFSMGGAKYKHPLQTILGMSNASNKKTGNT